jgi:hypothetical protein
MKAYWGVEVSSTQSLTSALDGGGQIHAPAALSQEKSPECPLDRMMGGPQSRFGRHVEEKKSQPRPGAEALNPHRPARSLVLFWGSHGDEGLSRGLLGSDAV